MRLVYLLIKLILSKRQHILMIVADDLGWNDISLHNPLFETPNIDNLIRDSVRLTNYYVNPICTPTRSVLLSGRYQIHTGLQHGVILGGQLVGMPPSNVLLPEVLRHCGYKNHLVGKWHLGYYTETMMPENRGFDTHYGYLLGAEDHYTKSQCMHNMCGVDFRDNGKYDNTTFGEYSSDLYTERIRQLVKGHDSDEPLFIYAALQNVHYPLQAPKKYIQHYDWIQDEDRKTYAAMTMVLDDSIKRIVESFKEKGIWNETIVYFTTDNGGSSFYGGNNFPYRGMKATLWEGGIKAVGSIKIPGVNPSTRSQLLHISDMFPTLLELCNCTLDTKYLAKLDGNDQSEMLKNNGDGKTEEFLINIDPLRSHVEKADSRKWESNFNVTVQAGIRWKQWKLLTGNPGSPDNHIFPPELNNKKSGIKLSEGDLLQSAWKKNVILFNIEKDPFELEDLSDVRKDIVEIMLNKLMSYNETAIPPQLPIFDTKANPAFHNGFWKPWVEY